MRPTVSICRNEIATMSNICIIEKKLGICNFLFNEMPTPTHPSILTILIPHVYTLSFVLLLNVGYNNDILSPLLSIPVCSIFLPECLTINLCPLYT